MAISQELQSAGGGQAATDCNITYNDIIDSATSPQVVCAITDQLLQIARVKHKNNKVFDVSNIRKKHETPHVSQKEPTQNSCNCRCCLSENNKHCMLTRHTKRNLNQNMECFPCCKNSPQKKKRKPQM